MVALIKTLQVILALSFLILIHELGHFAFSKMFGIRVDKFFLFFDIGGVKLFSTKQKWFVRLFPAAAHWETEYGIGWLPLGGYCKIAGMVDESMDLEQLKNEPSPREFRSHSAPQRLAVMAGGVLNNFIFAILAYIAIMAIWGETVISASGNRIMATPLAKEMGFENGDEILKLGDYVPQTFSELQSELVRRDVRFVTVKRGSDTLQLYIDRALIGDVLNSSMLFELAVPFVIDSVAAGSANSGCGLKHGDRIIAFAGEPVEFVQDAREVLLRHAGADVEATVIRSADTLAMQMQVDTAGRIGAYMAIPGLDVRRYNILQAVPAGLKLTGRTIGGYLRDLGLLARPETGAYKSVGSFIAIGQVFPSAWDWYQFMYILALLSIMLGVMNLIPIPGLDGGHILFTLYEMITGRKPSDRFLVVAQMIGLVLLVALMLLAFGNDIGRLIR